MTIIQGLLVSVVLSILLVKSASAMIKSSSLLARHFRLSEYTVSFFVIAFATSLPEFIVGVVSALDKRPSLSYGNVLGSNIADLTIILAIPIFVGGALKTRELVKNKDILYTAFFGLLPLALMLDGLLSRTDGLVLVLGYVFYLALVLRRSSFFESVFENVRRVDVYKNILIFCLSVAVLLLSADLLVKVAEDLSLKANLPLIFVGLTITAVGTSLPELVFGLKVVKTRHKGEVLGNLMGSVIANSTLVLGVTSMITPIQRNGGIGVSSIGFLVLTLLIYTFFGFRRQIGKLEALVLTALYITFILVEQSLVG